MSCWIPPLKVQHIPGCTGQYDFNLFSQSGSRKTQSCLEFQSHFKPSMSPCGHTREESRVADVFSKCVSHMCSPSKHQSLTTAIISFYTVISLRGITVVAHIALLQLKKQNVKGWRRRQRRWIPLLIQQRQIRVCLSLCEADFTGPSQKAGLSVKDTPKPLKKNMKRWVVTLIMTRWNNRRGCSPQTGYEKWWAVELRNS